MSSLILKDLIQALDNHSKTSFDLASYYIDRIKTYDTKLNAIACLNPNVLEDAKSLDEERKLTGPRSILHGIPVLIKDNIDVINMPNTANAYIMKDYIPKHDAPLIKTLKDAGMLILGKTNLSEWAYFMSENDMPSGYGSLHGQVVNPYDKRIDPLGSSTGSAVAVAADFAPLSIGTETNGSLMAPAYQNQIVSLKPTFGQIPNKGIIPISPTQDTAGPMARTVYDVSLLYDIMTQSNTSKRLDIVTPYKIGILHFDTFPYSEEHKAIFNEMTDVLTAIGYDIHNQSLNYKPSSNTETLLYEMKYSLNDYLKHAAYEHAKSLSDIITFNEKNPSKYLKYGQTLLVKSDQTSGDLNDPDYVSKRQNLLSQSRIFESLLEEENLDALVSVHWLPETPISGLPSIVVPAKTLHDLHPVSLVFIGKKHQEQTLLNIAHQYEIHTMKRIDPNLD
jgi:amidase